MSESDENKSLTPDDERMVDMIRKLSKNPKGPKGPASKILGKVEFMGEKKPKFEIQKELNELGHGDRMWSLTQNRKMELFRDLQAMRDNSQYEDGLALYNEHREMLNTKFYDDDDHDEAYWVMKRHLDTLYKAKIEARFWEEMKDNLQD